MYLERFVLPTMEQEEDILSERAMENGGAHGYIDNSYPCGLFRERRLKEINFKNITIFYGNNGSGKSTLLNVIAQKLELTRIAPYNTSEMMESYVNECKCFLACNDDDEEQTIPQGSRIITSDDIFDYMLAVRTNNDEISASKEEAKEKWRELKFGETIKFSGMEDYEALRMQVLSRKRSVSRRQFIKRTAGKETTLGSNGETAIKYFQEMLKDDTLYCLDEPENSMSPAMQLKLVKLLEESARFFGCQLIISTHSPFLLAMEGARIYDLDAVPVDIKNWWELENTRIYFDFFMKYKNLFE